MNSTSMQLKNKCKTAATSVNDEAEASSTAFIHATRTALHSQRTEDTGLRNRK